MSEHLPDHPVPIQRWKLDIILLIVFMFVIMGIWLLTTKQGDITRLSRIQDLNKIHFLGFALILIAGPAFYAGIGKRFKDHKELVLKWDGFHYQSVFVPWAEVTEISLHEPLPPAQVRVDVTDPERYADMGSEFQRRINRMNLKSHGTPFFIATILMSTGTEDLVRQMQTYWKAYQTLPDRPEIA